jgi:hypothetical protein
MGNGLFEEGKRVKGKGERGGSALRGFPPVVAPAVKGKELLPMPHAQCPMPNARC